MIRTEIDGVAFMFDEIKNNELEFFAARSEGILDQLEIPSTVNNKKVTQLYPFGKALSCCKTLIIPNSVTRIFEGTFTGNSTIQKVVWPDKCYFVPDECFRFSAVKEVVLPNYLESIGNRAFWYCPNLCKINLPDSIHSIGERAFESCKELREIHWPANTHKVRKKCFYNSGITHIDNAEMINSVDEQAFASTLINDLGQFSNLCTIGDSAFRSSKLTGTIQIPDTCLFIGETAFANLNIDKVIMLSPEISLGEGAFPLETEIDVRNVETLSISDPFANVMKINAGFETCVNLLEVCGVT